jgi:hypothetical protein
VEEEKLKRRREEVVLNAANTDAGKERKEGGRGTRAILGGVPNSEASNACSSLSLFFIRAGAEGGVKHIALFIVTFTVRE